MHNLCLKWKEQWEIEGKKCNFKKSTKALIVHEWHKINFELCHGFWCGIVLTELQRRRELERANQTNTAFSFKSSSSHLDMVLYIFQKLSPWCLDGWCRCRGNTSEPKKYLDSKSCLIGFVIIVSYDTMLMIITTIMMIVMIMMIMTIMMITDMIMITQELFLLWCASP